MEVTDALPQPTFFGLCEYKYDGPCIKAAESAQVIIVYSLAFPRRCLKIIQVGWTTRACELRSLSLISH